ncbi:unnamed protein product [Spirodela intermedia]|uniref:Phytocyanin domain-containing protein n=1 Tax=Spirodela intermedia TaxID=51605 RepID=A0A7I8K9N4_SPIIN|nr:unnamed protein product [Spirodela intermedia]
MAGTGGRSSAAASMALPLLLMAVVVATVVPPVAAAGVQFRVGGSMGWRVPAGDAESYNQWAERNRFKIGDSLLFAYPAGRDSVLLVTKEGFDGCDTASPPAASLGADGNTVFTFDRSGPFFFISGAGDNCRKGEKMVVIVLADRSNRSSPTAAPPSTPPSTPPPASGTPAPEPATTPSPPPSETPASPPPPAPPAIEIVPTTSPPEGLASPNGVATATTAAGFFVVLVVSTAAFL